MRRRWAAVVLAAAVAFGCSEEQAPDVVPDTRGSVTTSRALDPCPPGGPDDTTPAAGCLSEDGQVLRP